MSGKAIADKVVVVFTKHFGLYTAGEVAGFTEAGLAQIPDGCYKLRRRDFLGDEASSEEEAPAPKKSDVKPKQPMRKGGKK